MPDTPRRGRPRTRDAGPAIAIGEAIRQRREAAGLSQVELALACSISVRSLTHYETGTRTPPLDTAAALAKVLGCKVDAFLS